MIFLGVYRGFSLKFGYFLKNETLFKFLKFIFETSIENIFFLKFLRGIKRRKERSTFKFDN